MATLGSHAGNALPGMESTPAQRTTDSPTMGVNDVVLGSSTAQLSLQEDVLLGLERRIQFLNTPTGNAEQDECNQELLGLYSSPNSSDIQEKKLVEALGGKHKGGKKLGADGTLDSGDLECKPCKSEKPTTAVNITDDQPTRLIADIRNPTKTLVIGRCPGGLKFRWVIVCPMSDFAESRYLAMCKHWNHTPEHWPSSIEDQVKLVEALAEKRTKNNYLRSSQLKFKNIKTVLAAWVHPEIEPSSLKRRIEDDIIRDIWKTQRSVPQTASSHQVSQDLAE